MAIEIDSLYFSYSRKEKLIFSGLNLSVHPGRTMLIGANGAGKTTLIGLLARSLKHSRGTITYPASPKSSFTVSWMPQNITAIRSFTVAEQVSYIGWLQGCKRKEISANLDTVLECVNLADMKQAMASSLSGGQLRRLGIAQALITKPDLLILDEPTAGLDVVEQERLKKLLFCGEPLAHFLLVSTHDIRDLTESFDQVVALDGGKVAFSGSPIDFVSIVPDQDPVKAYHHLMGIER